LDHDRGESVLARIPGTSDVIADALSFCAKGTRHCESPLSSIQRTVFPVSKEQILAKMQEFEVILQSAFRVQSELQSMMAHVPDDMPFSDVEIPLKFNDNGYIIVWQNNCARFTPSTYRLLRQLWFAPNRSRSKEDVRQDVNEDEEASDGAVRLVIHDARQEMKNAQFPYEIETLWGKGYRLNLAILERR